MRKKGTKLPRGFITLKSEAFVENMAKPGMSAQRAAQNAGFASPGEGSRLLKNQEIVRRINDRKALAAEFCEITPEQILGATALRAFASIDDAFDENGNFDIKKARKTGAIHLIKKLESTQHGFKVEFYSNETAQEKLGNYLGLDKAPESVNDVNSLKLAIDEVALHIANGDPVSIEHRREAWKQVAAWTREKRARYSPQAIQEINKEFD